MAAPPRAPDVTAYTRLVRGLKIALPLLALALLSSLFLLPRETRFDGGMIADSADLLALAQGLEVTRPRISGATAAGEPFSVTAARAVPDAPDPEEVRLDTLRAEVVQAEGRTVRLAAAEGALRPKARTLSLSGGVAVDTSDGWRVRTARVEADLAAGTLTAPGPVRAEGPSGAIEAGRLVARRAEGAATDDGDALGAGGLGDYLRFDGGVRVRWTPPPEDPAAEGGDP